ncbi:MAG: Erythronate-4-phosphate dehydrogenase [Bacteroidetes bacterium]|nr:Erythronate-4-phosphate dehydrogenase [Bacteroidota bacterium]
MKILADSKIPLVREAFADIAEVTTLDAQQITADTVREADSLLVRSETKVNGAFLHGSRVRFVGTATIGTDHIDTDELQQRGIAFASAPGSNANSVAEYIVAALLVLAQRLGFSLEGRTLGVVGVGNIGKIVVRYAQALGMNVLQNDPPIARASNDPTLLPLEELMAADIITLHVPLTKSGQDKTYHLFDEQRLLCMKRDSIVINTSRGVVVDTNALKSALSTGHLSACVLDVWENEPNIDTRLLSLTTLGTPHIAGYSYDGKVNGTVMLHAAVCAHFGVRSVWTAPRELNNRQTNPIVIPENASQLSGLLAAVKGCYDIETDDRNLRTMLALPEPERAAYFRLLRLQYPLRREFHWHEVMAPEHQGLLIAALKALGFHNIASTPE